MWGLRPLRVLVGLGCNQASPFYQTLVTGLLRLSAHLQLQAHGEGHIDGQLLELT